MMILSCPVLTSEIFLKITFCFSSVLRKYCGVVDDGQVYAYIQNLVKLYAFHRTAIFEQYPPLKHHII